MCVCVGVGVVVWCGVGVWVCGVWGVCVCVSVRVCVCVLALIHFSEPVRSRKLLCWALARKKKWNLAYFAHIDHFILVGLNDWKSKK